MNFEQILGLYISSFVLKMCAMIDPSLKEATLFRRRKGEAGYEG